VENTVSTEELTTDASESARPTVLRGRYRLGDLIGIGGLAEVYRARDEFLGREVAVKIFRSTAAAESDFRLQEDEVNVLARLSHPNLVTLLDAAVDRNDPAAPRIYYVMELVEGTDLQHRLESGPLTPRQIAQFGYYIAAALELVHLRGIVHRDIKPSNILLATIPGDDSRLSAKLTDFGIASVGSANALPLNGIITGTVAYLSPEQAHGAVVGTASDIYSLGLVLLECFTRELAFPGPPQHSTMIRTIEDPPVPASVPEDWRPLLAAMTSRSPRERPDAHEVALALREKFASETGRHRQTPATTAGQRVLPPTADDALERVAALACRVLDAAIAIVTIDGSDQVWYSARDRVDAMDDPRALTDTGVAQQLGLHFAAEVPLLNSNGDAFGTLLVLDFQPRGLSADELATLVDLAAMASQTARPTT
jgi:serine/threonine protein kinase